MRGVARRPPFWGCGLLLHISQRSRQFAAQYLLRCVARLSILLAPFGLLSCGGGGAAIYVATDPGPSPFISMVHVSGAVVGSVTAVQYTIAPKPGSVSKPVHVEYSIAALQARGDVSEGSLTIPVFGLYAGYDNQVSVELSRQGGDPIPFEVDITTDSYVDASGVYSQAYILVSRTSDSSLGFSFIYMKSALDSPIIVDTDGEIRWEAPGVSDSLSSAFVGGSFIIGDATQPAVYRLGLDGSLTRTSLSASDDILHFAHDVNYGKVGLLAEPDITSGGVEQVESNLMEIRDRDSVVTILNRWDLGAIIGSYMSSQGDDAAAFVRPGADWFHLNSAIYDPSDDSIIVSSRENFVIKLDYSTGAIKWILGDPTKYWYTFPSLRAKALALAPGGLYPIGQHALSITPDGLLMLFNDGFGSINQPAGYEGQTRTYSAVSAYSIDPTSMTAQEVWRYDAGQTIYSSVCSSAYELPDKSLLIDYATADNGADALLVGLDADRNIEFEIQYPTVGCNTSWNARPFPLDDLVISR